MITSTLAHLHLYKGLHVNLDIAIDYALKTNFSELAAGQYTVDGDNIFFMVNEYTTKAPEDCEPERHHVYADIQIMIRGSERFGYIPFVGQEPVKPFLPDNDVAFYNIDPSTLSYTTIYSGQFIIFLPSDIHQPEVFDGEPQKVKKVVMKVRL